MLKIKIGEYVRTDLGKIFIYTREFARDLQAQDFSLFNDGAIIKHSKNIIDLIEIGDYVNGEKVEYVYLEGTNPYIKLANRNKNKIFENRLYDKDIKSIVTKEQFKSVEYEVGN